ncbi:LuxR C-terminal-related transcriptional regulator [Pseudogemmobacter sonorensis]|uniref:LuxR C-terminal-related transcriptional regulator n=1 Tax=Pseudogemmobacter sonorensis TaxID=2989681 RepID=UPI0036C1179E
MAGPEPHDLTDPERLAFRHAPDAILLLSDRVILRASLMVEEVFGWPAAALEGQSIRMLYPRRSDYEMIGARAAKALRDRALHSDERFMLRRDGQVVWMEARGRALDPQAPHRLAIWSYRPLEPAAMAARRGAEAPAAGAALTAAEKRVARHLVMGFTSKEIAQALECSPRTVEVHRANMIRKMGVRNSSELVARLLGAREAA